MSNPEADRNPDLITGLIKAQNPYLRTLREASLKGSVPVVRIVYKVQSRGGQRHFSQVVRICLLFFPAAFNAILSTARPRFQAF